MLLRADPIADAQSTLQVAESAESQNCFPFNFKGCEFIKTLVSVILYPSAMANEQQLQSRPWFLELVPLIVLLLIAAHVFALVFWIYRLAVEKEKAKEREKEKVKEKEKEKQPQRRKAH